MEAIELTLTAESPLAIGRQKPGGSISEAQDFIPGSVIRGALADLLLRQSRHRPGEALTGDLAALFTEARAAVFTHAYPGSGSRVLPATAFSSKNNPGFRSEAGKTGVFDTLLDRFCSQRLGIPFDPAEPDGSGGRVEPFGGFYSQEEGSRYRRVTVSKRLLTRVGINRRRATAADQILYSLEVINEGRAGRDGSLQPSLFSGHIYLQDRELAAALAGYLNTHARRLSLGGGVSRGLGRVSLAARHLRAPKPSLAERVAAFNQKLRQRWQQWQVFGNPWQPLPPERQYFSIGLQSGAILKERWQRTTVLTPPMLQEEANCEDGSLVLELACSSYAYVSGWNAAWGLFKDVELVTTQGSVFLLSTTQMERWIPILAEMEYWGIGERTAEGFGQIEVCSLFHHHFWENPL